MAHPEPVLRLVTVLLGLGAAGETSPAALLRSLGVREKLLPRAEDTCAFAVERSADLELPLRATFSARAIGFRFGRPRFHPAQLGGPAELVVEVPAEGELTIRASLQLGAGSLIVEGHPSALTVTAKDVEPSWVAAVVTALAGTTLVRVDDGSPVTFEPFTVPRTARLGASLLLDLGRRSARGKVTLDTPRTEAAPEGTSLVLEGAVGPDQAIAGTTLRGALAAADLLTTGAFDGALRPLPEGSLRVDATITGSLRTAAITGLVTTPRLRLAFHERVDGGPHRPSVTAPVIPLADVAALFRYDGATLAWQRLAARAYGGSLGGEGRLGRRGAFVGLRAALALRDVTAGEIPIDANGRLLSDLASGRLAIDLRFDRDGAGEATSTTAHGALCLEDGVFPVLQRAQAPLGKVGLGLPPQTASGPATCTIALHARGWTFAEVIAAVPGCATTGRVDVSPDGAVDGALVVKLGAELLEKSKLTLLPSLLADQLVVPVRITGAASRPHVDADLASCFGTLLSDAAGGVAKIFSRPPPPLAAPPARTLGPDPFGASARGDAAADDARARELVLEGVAFDEIAARLGAPRNPV
jgi:hypothetical protein